MGIIRFAIYGSLSPGEVNHHHVANIPGVWRRGWVEGDLVRSGWGAAEGFPGIRPRHGGPRVDVHILESESLDEHWSRLDEFEGDEYVRMEVPLFGLAGSPVTGFIYALRPKP